MAWLKVSDTAAMHPVVLKPLTDPANDGLDAHDRANLLCGLVLRCATLSAGYQTDYLVSDATVAQIGGPHWRQRAAAAERAGYWTRGGEDGWVIVDDPTNFVHIRLAAEIEWERTRRKDTSTAALVVPVRLRDGDGCRYCGRIVTWGDQKSGRGGTYDHRVPGKPAASAEDLRVSCRECNARRGADPDADTRIPPRPVPGQPHYGPKTVSLLAEHGHTVPGPRPGILPDPALRDPASSEAPQPLRDPRQRNPRTATRQPNGQRIEDHHVLADTANPGSSEFGLPGRDGRGKASPLGPHTSRSTRRARGRRGRKHR